jgi:hypothetical protein
LGIADHLLDQPIAVGAHATQINLRFGDASRRFQDIGVVAFANDPMCKDLDVARQIGIVPDRHVETGRSPLCSGRLWRYCSQPEHWQ